MFYAHSLEDKPGTDWHMLEEHLLNVAKFAKKFADEFRSGEWAYLVGVWHVHRSRFVGEAGMCSGNALIITDR